MDEPKNKNSHGFTWGMIVGGAVVLMLTTKRGRQILKELTEGGIEGIEEYIDLEKIKALTSEFDDEDEDIEQTHIITTSRSIKKESDEVVKPQKKKRRFFKKSK